MLLYGRDIYSTVTITAVAGPEIKTHKFTNTRTLPEHRGPRRADEAEAHALEALGAQVPGPRVDVEPRRRHTLIFTESAINGSKAGMV